MEQNNSKGQRRNGLSKLVNIVLAGSMLFTGIGCPWNKSKDRDTNSGSSGTPALILSQEGKDAVNKRFDDYTQVLMTAGSAANEGESKGFLRYIANAPASDTDANTFINACYRIEADSGYNNLCGGTSTTLEQFSLYFKYLCKTWTNGIAAAQTTDSAPYPVDGPIGDWELDHKTAGSGWGFTTDFTNRNARAYVRLDSIDEATIDLNGFTPEEMTNIKGIEKRFISRDYLDKETNDGPITYNPTTGMPVGWDQDRYDE